MTLYSLLLVLPPGGDTTALFATGDAVPLRDALRGGGYRLLAPLDPALLDCAWRDFSVQVREAGALPPDTTTFPVPGDEDESRGWWRQQERKAATVARSRSDLGHPRAVSDEEAVLLAYREQIDQVASLLRSELPVLVVCEKLIMPHLYTRICELADLTPEVLGSGAEEEPGTPEELLERQAQGPEGGSRQRGLRRLRAKLRALKEKSVLVLPHLDLLCGGADIGRHAEARELVELLYEYSDRLLLAFAHTTLPLPEVLAERFSVRIDLSGMPPRVSPSPGAEQPLCEALVTRAEAEHFEGFQAEEFFKHVAGMNPVRFRQAMRYSYQHHAGEHAVPVKQLLKTLLDFKAQQSQSFVLPDVTLDDIGGYEEVKEQIRQALRIIDERQSVEGVPDKVRNELIPRGFIFYGPPGTGKTLFAKAIAREMNATVQVVSGPEVTDMYVGESERKIRELFAAARRSAPSVLVFDEFDALASERTGRSDGASRAGNSVVAQILTEMDGFRPDVRMLVIGTTNKIKLIDAALLRPSRFQGIAIGLPDTDARRSILGYHAGRYGIDAELSGLLDMIADASDQCNGDELRSIVRDAFVGLIYRQEAPDAWRMGSLVGKVLQGHREKRTSGE